MAGCHGGVDPAFGPPADGAPVLPAAAALAEATRAHADADAVVGTRRRGRSDARERVAWSRDGRFRRDVDDYAWGDEGGRWWQQGLRSGSLRTDDCAGRVHALTDTMAREPWGDVSPLLADLDGRFRPAAAWRRPDGGARIVLVPTGPQDAWWDEPAGPRREGIVGVALDVSGDGVLERSVRRTAGGQRFETTWTDVVFDPAGLDDPAFEPPLPETCAPPLPAG